MCQVALDNLIDLCLIGNSALTIEGIRVTSCSTRRRWILRDADKIIISRPPLVNELYLYSVFIAWRTFAGQLGRIQINLVEFIIKSHAKSPRISVKNLSVTQWYSCFTECVSLWVLCIFHYMNV